jgi:hypothetical protein
MNGRALLAILALLPAVLVGCGGDDEASGDGGGGSSSGGEALTLTELAKEADAICKTGAQAAAKVTPPADYGQPGSDAGAATEYLGKIVPITRRQADDIAALEPADDVGADWDAFVDKQEELATFLEGVYQKAKDKDASGIEDLAKVPDLGEQFVKVANKVGATGCAGG